MPSFSLGARHFHDPWMIGELVALWAHVAAGGGRTIARARRTFEIAGRGCLVRIGDEEPRYATVAEIAAHLEPHPDAAMLLTAVSEAAEKSA